MQFFRNIVTWVSGPVMLGVGLTLTHASNWPWWTGPLATVLIVLGSIGIVAEIIYGLVLLVRRLRHSGGASQPSAPLLSARSKTGDAVSSVHAEGGGTAFGVVHGQVTIGVQEPISESAANHRAVIRQLRDLCAQGKILVARRRSPIFGGQPWERDVTEWKNHVVHALREIDEELVLAFIDASLTRPVNPRPIPPNQNTVTIPAASNIAILDPAPGETYRTLVDLAPDMPTAVATLEAIIERLEARGPQ